MSVVDGDLTSELDADTALLRSVMGAVGADSESDTEAMQDAVPIDPPALLEQQPSASIDATPVSAPVEPQADTMPADMNVQKSASEVMEHDATSLADVLDLSHLENMTASITAEVNLPPFHGDPRVALQRNRELQQVISAQVENIEQMLIYNANLEEQVKELIVAPPKLPQKKKKGESDAHQSFQSQHMSNPIPAKLDKMTRQKWTDKERDTLRRAVVTVMQQMLTNEMLEKAVQDGTSMTEQTRQELDKISTFGIEQLVEKVQPETIDWEAVSVQASLAHRASLDCRIQWFGNEDPRVNYGKWEKEEDKKLRTLAQKYKGYNWEQIAAELGTSRTPTQCFMRYQRTLNPDLLKSKWSPEDDEALRVAVAKYGAKNWDQVASCLDRRTGQQCMFRWEKSIAPTVKKGRWDEEEDAALVLAVTKFEGQYPNEKLQWSKIAKSVNGRTDAQCRERYLNCLQPGVIRNTWTAEEDAKLMQLVSQHGPGKWTRFTSHFTGRTDNHIWRRWKAMAHPDDVQNFLDAKEKLKKGLGHNFAGRPSEKPELEAQDLPDVTIVRTPKSTKKSKKETGKETPMPAQQLFPPTPTTNAQPAVDSLAQASALATGTVLAPSQTASTSTEPDTAAATIILSLANNAASDATEPSADGKRNGTGKTKKAKMPAKKKVKPLPILSPHATAPVLIASNTPATTTTTPTTATSTTTAPTTAGGGLEDAAIAPPPPLTTSFASSTPATPRGRGRPRKTDAAAVTPKPAATKKVTPAKRKKPEEGESSSEGDVDVTEGSSAGDDDASDDDSEPVSAVATKANDRKRKAQA